jgi:hypothetical protein
MKLGKGFFMARSAFRVKFTPKRKVYGTPWSKMAGGVELSLEVLNRLGKAMVKEIRNEARRAFAMRGVSPGGKMGLPASHKFYESINYRISGKRTVEIVSNWPWMDAYLEGRDPYPMTWLSQEKGVTKVPLIDKSGEVIIRMAPLQAKDAWIHPGVAKYSFIERGVKKGREKMAEIIREEVARLLLEGDPFS